MSCTGIPSVITANSGISASMASMNASLANFGGTNTMDTSAPVSSIASATMPNTGNSTSLPSLSGRRRPGTGATGPLSRKPRPVRALRCLTLADKEMRMTAPDSDRTEIEKWDPSFTERVIGVIRPVVKRWFRSEVRGLELIPPRGVLLVSNHSGGLFAVDSLVLAADFYDEFGYDRPVYTLGNDILFKGRIGDSLVRAGVIRASRDNAAKALRSGAVVVVYPAETTTRTDPRGKPTRLTSPGAWAMSPR
jgi:hypothetical protein